MTTKIVTFLKYLSIVLFLFISTISCEKDFENVGGKLVDNGVFNTKKIDVDLISYSKNIEASRVDNIRFLASGVFNTPITFGIYKTNEFGLLKASIATQILLPSSTIDWGSELNLDAAYIEIPYDATREANVEGKPKFKLNNIFGDADASYQIRVSRLETYLNLLNPLDPSKANTYYSNEVFNTSDELYPWTNFTPNANDTVLYFDRTMLDDNYNPIEVMDSIKRTDLNPFIRIPLDKDLINDTFFNITNRPHFDNINDFLTFFRGFFIEVKGINGSAMFLDLSKASLKLYYTNTETETDSNNVVISKVRTKETLIFPFAGSNKGIRTNAFERDYSGSTVENFIDFPNTVAGEKKIYIQGAQGSMAIIDLFQNINIDELRDKNWLINEASLILNIDQDASGTTVPPRLFLYKLDPDETNDENENAQILDMMTEGPDRLNGFLQKDGDDNPVKYKINITDYISEILKKEDFTTPSKLGLKLYHATDIPITTIDTIIEDYNWDPRGVVLYGNRYVETDTDYNKRLKLEIHYTEINE